MIFCCIDPDLILTIPTPNLNPFPNLEEHKKNKKSVDPKEFLGTRKDLTPKKMAEFAKNFKDSGATILGGCCETSPAHIKEMSKLV